MTPEGERLVRETWLRFEPIAENHVQTFYRRLDELDPGARARFSQPGIQDQGSPFLQTIGCLVASIDEPERFVKTLLAVCRRYSAFGLRHSDYESAGAALTWTMHAALGNGFTEPAREAWSEAYRAMLGVIRRLSTAPNRAGQPAP